MKVRQALAPKITRTFTLQLRMSGAERQRLIDLMCHIGISGSEVVRALIDREHAEIIAKNPRVRTARRRRR